MRAHMPPNDPRLSGEWFSVTHEYPDGTSQIVALFRHHDDAQQFAAARNHQ